MTRFSPSSLKHPIVLAPMGGGPSTPALAAAVSGAGGLGFLAAGYKTAGAVRTDIEAVRELTDAPFGVNVFAPPGPVGDPAAVERFAQALGSEADRYGTPLGAPRHDDDDWQPKLALMRELRVPVVSFTFGCPPRGDIHDLQAAGCAVWVTVTLPEEAAAAADAGADALVVQGTEAGGHRASYDDDALGDIGLLALLQLVQAVTDAPLIATGGVATGRGVAAVLAAGAAAAQVGTAFMLCPEAATVPAHKEAIAAPGDTALTRAFTGRTARGIVNRWLREHRDAPSAYPDIHYVTAKVRAAARGQDDPDGFNLWAGQAHTLAEPVPAAELVRRLSDEAHTALRAAADR